MSRHSRVTKRVTTSERGSLPQPTTVALNSFTRSDHRRKFIYTVDESDITARQAVVESHVRLQPSPFFKVGQRVIIQQGPLRNIEGVLMEIKDGGNLVIAISLLQHSIVVQISRDEVQPVAA